MFSRAIKRLARPRPSATFTVSDRRRLSLKRESRKRFRLGLACMCAAAWNFSCVPLTVLEMERKRNRERKCRARRSRCGTRAFLLSRDKKLHRLLCVAGAVMGRGPEVRMGTIENVPRAIPNAKVTFEYKEVLSNVCFTIDNKQIWPSVSYFTD